MCQLVLAIGWQNLFRGTTLTSIQTVWYGVPGAYLDKIGAESIQMRNFWSWKSLSWKGAWTYQFRRFKFRNAEISQHFLNKNDTAANVTKGKSSYTDFTSDCCSTNQVNTFENLLSLGTAYSHANEHQRLITSLPQVGTRLIGAWFSMAGDHIFKFWRESILSQLLAVMTSGYSD